MLWEDKLERKDTKELKALETIVKVGKIYYYFIAFYLVFNEILKPTLIQNYKFNSKSEEWHS